MEGDWPAMAPPRDQGPLNKADEELIVARIQTVLQSNSIRQHSMSPDGQLGQATDGELAHEIERRTSVCQEIVGDLERLWRCRCPQFRMLSHLIANAAREGEWRIALGKSGILDFYCRVIAGKDLDSEEALQSLRVVGNTCAEMDENRARVLEGNFDRALLALLADEALAWTAIVVLYNFSCEFGNWEAARKQMASHGLVSEVLETLNRFPTEDEEYIYYACSLIEIGSIADASNSPDHVLRGLLDRIVTLLDNKDSFMCILSAIASHLEVERFQSLSIQEDLFSRVLLLLHHSYTFDQRITDTDEEKRLATIRVSLNQLCADISDLPEFPCAYPVGSGVFNTLMSWLDRKETGLQICASVVLGNLARNHVVCDTMLNDYCVHVRLVRLLRQEKDRGSTIYSVLGFLKNLTVNPYNRETVEAVGVIEATSPFWTYTVLPQVQAMSVSLTRQIVTGSFENTRRILQHPPSDETKTYISLLMEVFKTAETKPLRSECARAAAAVIRTIGIQKWTPFEAEAEALLQRFISSCEYLDQPISFMIGLSEFPSVQGEGLFALVMLSQCQAGVEICLRCLDNPEVVATLKSFANYDPASDQSDIPDNEKVLKDAMKSNTLTFMENFTKDDPPGLSQSLKQDFRDLVRQRVSSLLQGMPS